MPKKPQIIRRQPQHPDYRRLQQYAVISAHGDQTPGSISDVSEQIYIWRVATRYPERKGTLCRVLVRGRQNSCLVEFIADGYRTITSRNYIRKYKETVDALHLR